MSVGGRVYSSFSTSSQIIQLTSGGGGSSSLIPNVEVVSAAPFGFLKNAGLLPVECSVVQRNVLGNIVSTSIVEILESGTYLINFFSMCAAPQSNGNYSSIRCVLFINQGIGYFPRATQQYIPTSESSLIGTTFQLVTTVALIAGSRIRVDIASESSQSGTMVLGDSSYLPILSLVKVAPYSDNN